MAHQNKKTSLWMSFYFHTKTEGIRTREGMSVIRMSGEHSNSEWSEGDRAGAEEAVCKQGAAGGQIPSTAPSTVTI